MKSLTAALIGVVIVLLIGVAVSGYLTPRFFSSLRVSTQTATPTLTVTTLTGQAVPVPPSIAISTTQVNTITTADLPAECNGLQPLEGEPLEGDVLFMNLTSTACMVVTYVTPAGGSNFPAGGIVRPGVEILKRSCYQNSTGSVCSPYKSYNGSFATSFAPSSVNLTGFEGSPAEPFSSTFSVVYLLHPFGNATGFYDMDFLAADLCGGGNFVFSVGYPQSQVNGSDFSSVVNPAPPHCFVPLCFVLSVSVANMGYESIVIPPP